jgi:hypothetical protein
MPDKFDPSTVPAFNTPGLSEAASTILAAIAAHREGQHANGAEAVAGDFAYVLTKLRAFGA